MGPGISQQRCHSYNMGRSEHILIGATGRLSRRWRNIVVSQSTLVCATDLMIADEPRVLARAIYARYGTGAYHDVGTGQHVPGDPFGPGTTPGYDRPNTGPGYFASCSRPAG